MNDAIALAEPINTAAEVVAARGLPPLVEFLALCALAFVLGLAASLLFYRAARGRREDAAAAEELDHERYLRQHGLDPHNGFLDTWRREAYKAWRVQRLRDEWNEVFAKVLPDDVLAYMLELVPDPHVYKPPYQGCGHIKGTDYA